MLLNGETPPGKLLEESDECLHTFETFKAFELAYLISSIHCSSLEGRAVGPREFVDWLGSAS